MWEEDPDREEHRGPVLVLSRDRVVVTGLEGAAPASWGFVLVVAGAIAAVGPLLILALALLDRRIR